ncbi:haloacid dehalogenase type II [Amycolatopsis viridis]|uniref:2-haloacid dehalogenase n=1 Tax=Amycolatopsis viridis TaxID=185678 RepID=A0ABX0SRT8_9PSEU|nr:haloacid dehalogenase type II [Amycolatopsis viridis]NIH79668.1 2-haloacid dehalogenase [Amycolatopsis viridis]
MTEQTESLTGVKALMFDFYGTVVDMQSGLTKAITPYLRSKNYTAQPPNRVVTWWRRTHFENSMIDGLLGREHIPYREIGRQTVDYTLTRAGIPHTMDEVRELVSEIERLEPFPDVVEALGTLKEAGFKLVILSNGDPDMLESGVKYSGTEDLWTRVVSVAEAGAFKPHFATYATGAKAVGLDPSEVLFVANHAFDCVGAKAAGMRTAFVDRRKRPFGNEYYPPTLVVDDFAHLAREVIARTQG